MLAVGVGSVPILALELIRDDLTHGDRVFLWVVNITVAVVFTIDYLVELYLSSNKKAFVREEKIGLAIGFSIAAIFQGLLVLMIAQYIIAKLTD